VSVLAGAAPAGSSPDTVTIITGAVLALAAIVSSLTPLALARRRAQKEALAAVTASAVNSSDLTLAGWVALNGALQEEIRRLQGVTERMQKRIDQQENEITVLQHEITALRKLTPGA